MESITATEYITTERACLMKKSHENAGYKKLLKRGIYLELHKRGLLSDSQLSELLKMQKEF